MTQLSNHEPVTRTLADVTRRALTTPSGRPVEGVSPAAMRRLVAAAEQTDRVMGAQSRRPDAVEDFMEGVRTLARATS